MRGPSAGVMRRHDMLARSRPKPCSRRNTNQVFLLGPGSGCTADQMEPGYRNWLDNQTAKI